MDLRKCILTKNACYKAGRKITPSGVMWHSTGVNNPNLKRYVQPDDGKLGKNPNGNHWNQNKPDGREVCVHAFIGKDKNGDVCTYQTLPWNYRGWHCGGSGNSEYISFEICEDDLKDKNYFNKVYKEAVELTAYLCKKYGLNPKGKNVIICHQDGYKLGIASNHSDVYHWFNKYGKDMNDVRKDVAKAMRDPSYTPPVTSSNSTSDKTSNSSSSKTTLKVDGYWGSKTTRRLQEIFGTTVDGKVSNQFKAYKAGNPGLDSGWEWESDPDGYSPLIKAIQKKVGATQDGHIGPNTIKKIQKWLGCAQDGCFSGPSPCIKKLQQWCNKQK